MTNPSDDRSWMASALQWASTIMTISLEMVIPGLVGYWLDQKLGTRVFLTLLGFAGGMALALWHLLRVTSNAGRRSTKFEPESRGKPPE